jgi:hypothetical protein
VAAAVRDTRLGRYVTTAVGGERVRAFVPPPLPPVPPIRMAGLLRLLEEANRAVGRLDGVTSILPGPPLFIYMYVRKEAVLSSPPSPLCPTFCSSRARRRRAFPSTMSRKCRTMSPP